jgi:NTF2-related export protein 1/2
LFSLRPRFSASEMTLHSVEIANRGADEFLRVYYATYDSAQRAEGVTKFYRDTSCLTYNGTAVTGPTAIRELLERLPVTKHEVQSYDCHSIPSERASTACY